MTILAATTFCLLAAVPQSLDTDENRFAKTLSSSDVATLKQEAKELIAASDRCDGNESASVRKEMRKARQTFVTTVHKISKKGNILKSMGDMLAIFESVFPYESVSTSGDLKAMAIEGSDNNDPVKFHLHAPRGYDYRKSYRSVLVLRGWDRQRRAWAPAETYMEGTWNDASSLADTFFLLPEMLYDEDYDKAPDLRSSDGRLREFGRIASVLRPLGELQRTYRLDRTRVFLDCGPGTSAFGLRLTTYFPDRFAGVILRHPTAVDELRLESLAGSNVLLISTGHTTDACNRLKKRLDDIRPGKVTVVDAQDAAPHRSAMMIDAWVRKRQRTLYPTEVMVAPNHDRFKDAHWLEITHCEPLDAVDKDRRPLVKAKIDRNRNRIMITSRGVMEVRLILNDALLDLDRNVSLVINGRDLGGLKITRSVPTLLRELQRRYDPTHLYPAAQILDLRSTSLAAVNPRAQDQQSGGQSVNPDPTKSQQLVPRDRQAPPAVSTGSFILMISLALPVLGLLLIVIYVRRGG